MAQQPHTAQSLRRFLRLPDVKQQVGLGRTSIYAKIKAGEFPAPYPLSANGRAVAWLSEDIEKWFESRIKTRNARWRPQIKARLACAMSGASGPQSLTERQ